MHTVGKKISLLLSILLLVALVAVSVPQALADDSLSFDELIEAGKAPTEFTVTTDKTAVAPGETVTVTVSVTGGGRSITHYIYYPVWSSNAFEVVSGEVIGIGLQADTGAVFQMNSGAIAVFSTADVRTGDLFRYTIKVKDTAAYGTYNLASSASTRRDTKVWNCNLVDGGVTVADPAVHYCSFTNYIPNNDATCTQNATETAKCDGCELTDTRQIPESALGHDYVKTVTPPTCQNIGFSVYDCSRCDENDYVAEEKPVTDHSYTHYVSDENATCTEDGTKTAACDYECGETDTVTDTGSQLPHSFNNYIPNNDATWEKDGTETSKCDNCEATDTRTIEGTKLPHGWVEEEGDVWYYYYKGKMTTGWLAYGPVWYYFNEDGTMFRGFLYYGGHYYYFNDIGRMHTGWAKYSGEWYYMDANGYRVTGIVTIDGVENEFSPEGIWIGKVQKKNGWSSENGKWYYYKDNQKLTGWLDLNGTWYYFNPRGEMTTGWLAYGPVWYYFNSDGAMRTGWLTYGGQSYYFDTAVTNYGRMVVNKWIKDGGNWYYFDANGYRVTGSVTIGGKVYNFDQNGICLNP